MIKHLMLLAIVASLTAVSSSSRAYQLSISQYGRVTATLPWAVAMEKGYFDEAGRREDR
jgi:ABC-type nitrate/sulfonate/bicarbonate transport system substrate-binding protein